MSTPSQTNYSASQGNVTMTATWQSGSTWVIRYTNPDVSDSENDGNILLRAGGQQSSHMADDNAGIDYAEITIDATTPTILVEGDSEDGGFNLSSINTSSGNYVSINITDTGYAPTTGATYRVNVTARNVDHWSWSLDGGADNMMPSGSTYADITIGESAPITVKGMDASHNVLATDTYVIESTATPSLPALVIPENWVTVTRQWSGYGFNSSRKCHATLTWSAITGASGYRIRLEERQGGYATGVHPQNTWEYNPTEYEFTTTGTTFEKDFFVAIDGVWQNIFNYIVTALGTTGESSDSEFPELINGSRTSFGQAPGGGVLNIHEPDDDDDDD